MPGPHKQQPNRQCDDGFYLSTLLSLMVVSWADLKWSQETDNFKEVAAMESEKALFLGDNHLTKKHL